MEKKAETIHKIVITGPESTGKTWLTENLAKHFNTCYVPEYARDYILSLKRKYNYDDISHIAEKQIEIENKQLTKAKKYLFYDTFLIITKIWFIWCYNKYPVWIDEYLKKSEIELFLLCDTDLPWVHDNVRENSGENRIQLFNLYKEEIIKLRKPYKIISGVGEQRLIAALTEINKLT